MNRGTNGRSSSSIGTRLFAAGARYEKLIYILYYYKIINTRESKACLRDNNARARELVVVATLRR